jgi:hypothetical protein
MLTFALTVTAQAQGKKANNWKPEAVVGINLSQVSFSNWAAGGEDNLSWNFIGEGKLNYTKDKLAFSNYLKLDYGQSKIGGGLNKVIQNDLLYNNRVSYKSGWIFDYYAGANLITQIAPGYDYGSADPVQVTAFFDPADVTESAGLLYDKSEIIKTQLGLGFHQVFANKFTATSDDPATTEIETAKYETGIESITNLKLTLDKNILWTSYLRLFSAFDRLQTWDVRWDNTVTASVNSWLNVNFTLLMVYNKAQIEKTQIKEALQLGVSYKLF